ncbi:MAG: hypothetical protein KJZ69_05225 [Phycisphaerales bacterium]|nr:hypothetical protein [Phycisphaerales bacterium]
MMNRVLIAATAVVLALPAAAPADHIPGHRNYDPTWPVPLPGRQHFNGGVVFVTAIGPLGGYEITHALFDIAYVSDGQTPARDLEISVEVTTEAGPREIHVTGADLGFGSGPGTFKGTFSTHDLDGVVVPGFLGPYSLIHLTIGSVNGGIEGEGYFVNSAIILDVTGNEPSLAVTGACPGPMTFTVTGAQPGQRIALLYARGLGSMRIPSGGCAGQTLGLDSTVRLGAVTTSDSEGRAVFQAAVPPAACGRIHVQAVDALSCLVSEVRAIQ